MQAEIFFISYSEKDREKNWSALKKKQAQARRIHRVKGLALAHQIAARLSKTDFFFVVNGDNEICEDFKFQTNATKQSAFNQKKPAIYCWRSLNPVNQLVYGFGGVKLFPKSFFTASPACFVDLSTSFNYVVVHELASITRFNSSPLEAWRSAFRECVKLSSECIHNQKSKESQHRLKVWCEKGKKQKFGDWVLLGAKQGKEYGRENKNKPSALAKINDFDWLKQLFIKNTRAV